AKAEIDGWPLFGALCRSVNTIFIDRKAKRRLPEVIVQVERTLAAGQGVVIFAEGTSGAGDRVLPFRSSLLDLPARLGEPVRWAALGYGVRGDAAPAHLAVTWWGDMPLGPHLWSFLQLRGVDARLVLGAEPVAAGNRKQLSEALFHRVSGAFEPMVATAEVERLLALRETDPAAVPPILRPRPGSS
ncbi:MAG TPA: lysophospholipid acyltransferase family protein, partial [Thermoanaerobaculia bacterium]|nr:lysophospholipid acyltransferase family protein [Thermoanaerobaculia bacterium]